MSEPIAFATRPSFLDLEAAPGLVRVVDWGEREERAREAAAESLAEALRYPCQDAFLRACVSSGAPVFDREALAAEGEAVAAATAAEVMSALAAAAPEGAPRFEEACGIWLCCWEVGEEALLAAFLRHAQASKMAPEGCEAPLREALHAALEDGSISYSEPCRTVVKEVFGPDAIEAAVTQGLRLILERHHGVTAGEAIAGSGTIWVHRRDVEAEGEGAPQVRVVAWVLSE
jgi:hypothetical protein